MRTRGPGPLRWALAGSLAAAVTLAAAGCGSDVTATSELTVYAAASLKGPFTEIGERFEAAHPGTTVVVNFAGSSDLVAQLDQGAPADVLATADEATMAQADDLVAAAPQAFATNSLTIAVPLGNPAGIDRFADLAAEGVRVVTCAPQVPCGAATERVEHKTGVELRPVSEEQSVTDVLNKVAADEADAGVVYVTDVEGASDRVEGVAIPARDNTVNTYPIAALRGAAEPARAQEFTSFVLGADGQAILAEAGFGTG